MSWPGSHDISVVLVNGSLEMTLTLLLANRKPLQTDSCFWPCGREAWTLGKGEAGLWGPKVGSEETENWNLTEAPISKGGPQEQFSGQGGSWCIIDHQAERVVCKIFHVILLCFFR